MADKLKENIAKAMKNYRENTGMTQQELADELGIARGTLRKVESGEGDINLTSMITFAHMARIDLNSLLESEKEKYAIVDTNVLLQRPKYLQTILERCEKVYIPRVVIQELNNLKDSGLRYQKKLVSLSLSIIVQCKEKFNNLDLDEVSNIPSKNDDRILNIALKLAKNDESNDYYLITNDKDFKLKSLGKVRNLKIVNITEFDDDFIGVDDYDKSESLAFFKAVSTQKLELAKEYTGGLHKGVDFNYLDSDTGYTPLIQAIRNKDYEMVKFLLSIPTVDIDKVDCKKYSLPPISHAIQIRNNELVELLIENGANVNAPSQDERNPFNMPLMIASWHGNYEVVKLLLESNASVNQVDRGNGFTALTKAVIRNHLDCIELLLDYGADKSIFSFERKTALDYALENNARGQVDKAIELLAGDKND